MVDIIADKENNVQVDYDNHQSAKGKL